MRGQEVGVGLTKKKKKQKKKSSRVASSFRACVCVCVCVCASNVRASVMMTRDTYHHSWTSRALALHAALPPAADCEGRGM